MIESTQNRLIKELKNLKTKAARDEKSLFIAEGLKFVMEIPNDWEIENIFVSHSFEAENDMSKLRLKNKVVTLSDLAFKSISDTKTPQGVLAVCKRKEWDIDKILNENLNHGFYIIAEELNDPGNLGTIIRTADACGANGVFLSSGCVDLYNGKVLRSTMGSLFHVPVVQDMNISEIISKLHSAKVNIFGAHLNGKNYPYSLDLKKPCAILIGNESRGLSHTSENLCDTLVKIPMPGKAESLNASVAAGVLMYEAVRQRME